MLTYSWSSNIPNSLGKNLRQSLLQGQIPEFNSLDLNVISLDQGSEHVCFLHFPNSKDLSNQVWKIYSCGHAHKHASKRAPTHALCQICKSSFDEQNGRLVLINFSLQKPSIVATWELHDLGSVIPGLLILPSPRSKELQLGCFKRRATVGCWECFGVGRPGCVPGPVANAPTTLWDLLQLLFPVR